jgi:hypothetical protein
VDASFLQKCFSPNTKEIKKTISCGLCDKVQCSIMTIRNSVVIRKHLHLAETDSGSGRFLFICLVFFLFCFVFLNSSFLACRRMQLESNPSIF